LALPEPIQIAMVATILFDQLYIHRLIVRCMPTPADGGKRWQLTPLHVAHWSFHSIYNMPCCTSHTGFCRRMIQRRVEACRPR
jgi:hypothetical protein